MDEEFLEICIAHREGSNKMISIGYRKPTALKLSPALAFVTTQHAWVTSAHGLLYTPEVLLPGFSGLLHLPGKFPLALYLAHLVESPSSISDYQLHGSPANCHRQPHLSSADFLQL